MKMQQCLAPGGDGRYAEKHDWVLRDDVFTGSEIPAISILDEVASLVEQTHLDLQPKVSLEASVRPRPPVALGKNEFI